MPQELFVVAGQSNGRRFDSTGIMTGAVIDAGIDGTVLRVVEPGTAMAPSPDRNDWYPFEDDDPATGELVRLLLDEVGASLAAEPGQTVKALVWMQGETDANPKIDSSDYQQKLQALYDLVRAAFDADFPFLVMRLSDHAPGLEGREADWAGIQAAQAAFAAANPEVILFDPDLIAIDLGIPPQEMFRDAMHLVDAIYEVIADLVIAASVDYGPPVMPETLRGTSGEDVIESADLGVIVTAFKGHDTITTGAGDDTVDGGRGLDVVRLGLGDDLCLADKGNDLVFGDNGDDTLIAGRGNDTLSGGQGRDLLSGNDGADRMAGGNDADTLRGGLGDDWLIGGAGDDDLRGDAGADTFEFRLDQDSGHDTLHDFETGLDRIVIVGAAADITLTDLGDRVQVAVAGLAFDILTGAGQAVSQDDFVFA